ncbi:MAG: alpha/beta hydrolase [bacterium]
MEISTAVAIFTTALVVIVFWGWYSSNLIIHTPKMKIETNPCDYGLEFEAVSFYTADNIKISGWFVPAENANNTVIICHGWGTNKADVLPGTQFLRRYNMNLLYFDFRNHGESGGDASSLVFFEMRDLKAAIEFLKKEKREKAKKIGVLGFSMGGSVSLMVASEDERVSVVAADSPFSDVPKVIIRYAKLFYGFPKFPLVDIALIFVRIRLGINLADYSPVNYIADISPRPLLIIQGGQDLRMPVEEGRALFEQAKQPKELWIVQGADHLGAYAGNAYEYEKKIGSFFKNYLEK